MKLLVAMVAQAACMVVQIVVAGIAMHVHHWLLLIAAIGLMGATAMLFLTTLSVWSWNRGYV